MIDICIPIYYNYDLLDLQINMWNRIKGDFRLIFCDNTPLVHKQPKRAYRNEAITLSSMYGGIDGESHGAALDFLVSNAQTDIVCVQDSDLFWLDKDILSKVQDHFDRGCKSYGVECWYSDFDLTNSLYPERAGWLSPSVMGMFIDRKLAMSETFIVTATEGHKEFRETGWRMCEKIITEKIPCSVIGVNEQCKREKRNGSIWYGDFDDPIAFHWIKGSTQKTGVPKEMMRYVQT